MLLKLFISSDHAGVKLKSFLIKHLLAYSVIDLGPNDTDAVDYPDFADSLCKKLKNNPLAKGILICGSGQGMVMRANKYLFIRAGLGHQPQAAQKMVEHNQANVLCLAARAEDNTAESNLFNTALKTTEAFLKAEFQQGRHSLRVKKIQQKPELS